MLTRRTNVLLSEQDYAMLSKTAKREGVSKGELIRRALKETYLPNDIQDEVTRRKSLVARIKRLRKSVIDPHIATDFKALVNYGRKY